MAQWVKHTVCLCRGAGSVLRVVKGSGIAAVVAWRYFVAGAQPREFPHAMGKAKKKKKKRVGLRGVLLWHSWLKISGSGIIAAVAQVAAVEQV